LRHKNNKKFMTKKSILMILLLMAMLSLTCTNVYANPTDEIGKIGRKDTG
jgi:PBP1b-binding outer membrane lipoprotein LpoB